MKTSFFIGWRYQRGKQKNRLVSLISIFSTMGIMLGVAVLIIGLSAMNGFQRELDKRILAVVPHAEITGHSYADDLTLLNNWQDLAEKLENNPDITALAPYVTFTALVESGNRLKVAQIRGVDKFYQDQVSALGQFILDDAWQHFDKQDGIVLGAAIARDLGVKAGDWVSLLISQADEADKLSQPQRYRIQVSGILRLDGQLDHAYALIPLKLAQRYLGYGEKQVNGVELSLKNPFAVDKLDLSALYHYSQPLFIQNWTTKYGYMYRDVSLIRTVMYIAMVLVIGVACFNIISTLMMAVKDKQGDIAVLRTLGANSRLIKNIFLWYGLLSGMKGCIYGIILGCLTALNLTTIIQLFERLIGIKILSDGVYFIDFLPSELHWLDVVLVFICAVLLSLLASIYPAMKAAKLQPARVLSGH